MTPGIACATADLDTHLGIYLGGNLPIPAKLGHRAQGQPELGHRDSSRQDLVQGRETIVEIFRDVRER